VNMSATHITGYDEPGPGEDALAHQVIGAALEVHSLLGPGYLESVYENALCLELELRNVPYVWQHAVQVHYKAQPVGEGRLDLLVGGVLVVELKTVEMLMPIHSMQLHSYLKATNHKLGLLINFNVSLLKNGIKRVVLHQSP
jgi:GxxExxY protein